MDQSAEGVTRRLTFAIARSAVSIGIAAAVVGQLATSIGFWRTRGDERIDLDVANFLSFFTIQSNVLAAVVLMVGAVFIVRNRRPRWFLYFRASAATYMVTTGIVYNLLLRGIELPQGSTVGWSNEILHLIAPLYLLLDWIFAPDGRAVRWKGVGIIVVYPIVWAAYTLVRGPLILDQGTGATFWYPYPFLNPNGPGGYGTVAIYVVAIAVAILLVASGVIWFSRRFFDSEPHRESDRAPDEVRPSR
ncbi:Pr6Pr family membrane protein [Paramicrobacterium chengjingii]|uniref:Pr6Pr family membrane protein n=1 Tax=Paramicrobacterium chengjingii TaxID=2769067 RepID=A0ABX6YL76_9MICO|nr:Pr6Pr family membrane protein [Microbacterium chengjingii]QPZ39166.1 Pr6Pr family membrane protein [Microbacterium chengjingii]